MESKLKVAEHFLSFQCEGQTIGKRAVFLRLSGCKLACKWCDTIEVWRKGRNYSIVELLRLFQVEGYADQLSRGAHLIITGGDPLIQQKELVHFIVSLRDMIPIAHIEVETEGVIMPDQELYPFVELWNVSPKLSNSGMKKSTRYHPEVLKFHSRITRSIFKFPVSTDADITEVKQICHECEIPNEKVYLMPVCHDRATFVEHSARIADKALTHHYHFSPRVHLAVWNQATGV